MKRYMRLFIVVWAMMGFFSIQKTYAEDYFKTMGGSSLSSVLTTGPVEEDSRICYLYNLGDMKMLNAGATYGMQASMFTDVGLRFWLLQSQNVSGAYVIQSDCATGDAGTDLGVSDNGSGNIYVDGGVNTKVGTYNCDWHIIQDANDKNSCFIYYVEKVTDENNHVTYVRHYLHTNPNPTSDSKKDRVLHGASDSYPDQASKKDPYYQWYIITQAQLKSLFSAGTIGDVLDNPADATFYLNDPDLSRNNIHEKMWRIYNVNDDGTLSGDGASSPSLRLGSEGCSKSKITLNPGSTGTREGDYSGDNANDGFIKNNAAYFCADIKDANVKFYQTFKVDKAGWYTLQCQGFYRKGSNSNAKAVLYATIDNYTMTNDLNDLANMDEDGPADMLAAGKAFAKNEYPSGTMFLHITDDDVAKEVEITVGIQTSGKPEWTAFDDFQLKYNGTGSVLILDEMKTQAEMTKLGGNSTLGCKETFKNKTMFLHRDFTPGVWSTIILPVTISKYKFFQAFGAGSKLARFSGLSSTNVMRFQLVDDATTPLSASSDYLVANIPYIVKVTKLPSIAPIDFSSDLHDIKTGNSIIATFKIAKGETYYSFPYITLDKENYEPSGFKDDKVAYSNATYKILAHGKLYCDTKADLTCQSAYILNGNQLRYVTPGTKIMMKAFRCWFTVNNIADGTQYSKGVTLDVEDQEGNVIQTLEDTSTGLVDVTADTKEGKSLIYNMNGQLVKGTLDELPRGLYIVNGKKYVVK